MTRELPTVYHFYNRHFFAGNWAPSLIVPGFRTVHAHEDLLGADCVIVHLPSILATNPTAQLYNLRRQVAPGQIWVAETLESTGNYPQLDCPDFMALFDIEMSYRQSADIWTPYLPGDLTDTYRTLEIVARKKICCAFVSSSWDVSGRRAYMKELMQKLKVHSYGKYMRNRRLWFDRGERSKLKTLNKYNYTLAFENSIAPDYVTEKFYQPLLTGTVPIYLGAPNVADFAPGDNCFINVDDFNGPAELAAFVKQSDPVDFQAWRTRKLHDGFLQKLDRARRPRLQVLSAMLTEKLSQTS